MIFSNNIFLLISPSILLSAFANNSFNSPTVYSLFTFGLFLIDFALNPNLSVDSVSEELKLLGEQVIIKQVLALPPSDSWSTLVSLLSLYGTYLLTPSVSLLITMPRVVKDLLIVIA